ncbi:putative T7SS-secreted protein [Streptomyces xanthophaeus]
MVDFGGLVDKGLDKLEEGVDAGKKLVGEGIDTATDAIGDGLEYVGADDWADSVEDWGDRTASSLGAKVGEQQLGQTEEADELIHGKVADINASVKNLRDFQSAFDSVGQGMKGLDSSRWKGEAANAFREKFQTLPTDWLHAADAFEAAAKALETYATTVTWAQGKAKEAIALYKKGQEASKSAVDAYNQKVDAYNDARTGDKPLPKPDPFTDPGQAGRDRAQEVLNEARRQRNDAADTANKAVAAALAHAPAMPSATDRAQFDLADWGVGQGVEMLHFGGGVVKGVVGITNFVRAISPFDLYNITHPADYYKNVNMTLAGLASTAAHPDRALKNAWDAAKGDPAEFLGRLLPEIIGTKGAGVIRGGIRAGMRSGMDDLAKSGARNTVDKAPEGAHSTPDGDRKAGGDPVDLATGRMFLPQTDVEIPGILPLLFTRRTESGCAVGRFLGPAWTSTVDERLEIDAVGVVHVTAEGLLITYPHPAPGVPTRPETGRACTLLARDADGDYTVTDTDSRLVFRFTAPSGSEPGGNGEAWLSGITERNGHTITVDRSEDGLPLALVHSAGHRITVSVADGLVTSLSLADAAEGGADLPLMGYGYEYGNLTTVTKPSGASTAFVYDDRRRVVAWIDSNGSRYDYAYDERDRVVAEGGEAGHVQITLAYTDPSPETGHRTTTLTTADGHATHHVFGPGCRLLAVTDPLGHTTRFTYDPRGNLLTRTDALGLTTVFSYDKDGHVVGAIRPDGSELRTVRGLFGLPVEVIAPDGARIQHEYDDRGNRTAVTDPAGATTRYTYDHAARLTSLTDALGATTHVVCDAAGLPVEVTDPAGSVTRTKRDALGRPVRITDPVGGVTHLQWHPDGQLARRTGPDGSTESWTYDGEGNLLTRTDAVDGVTRFEYTHFDLPVARTDADGTRYEFEHDAALRLTSVTNPYGRTWTYEYDAADDIVSETDFDGRTLTYCLDAVGRLATRVDTLGGTISFERDRLGQAVRKEADGRATTYTYDRAGRLLEAAGPDGELCYQYDQRGLTKTELVDGRPITYEYDTLGRRTSRTTPTGHVTSYTYDSNGRARLLTTGGKSVEFTHDAAGRELARVFGDAITVASAWDEAGRLSEQHITATGRAVNSRTYSYRADGHLTSVADRLSGTRTFDLDRAGRVTAVNAQDWMERYAYDDTGNQSWASWPSGHPGGEAIGSRAYAGTRLTRAGDVRFEYDALGRIVLRQKTRLSRKPDTWRYTWDAESRLTSVTTPDGTRWRYRHDPLGRRTAKQRLAADGESVVEEVRFTWDGLTLCEQTSHQPDRPNTVALTWDHRGDVPMAQTERILTADDRQEEVDRRFFAIATDLIGTPTELIDEFGEIAWRIRATLWGTTAWARDSSTYTPLRFPGQYYDPETGLHYNLFRHYDPETGRYVSPDPLGLAPAPNPLTYVDNPHSGSDPLGLMPKYTKEEKAQKARQDSIDAINGIVERAEGGKMKKADNYHAHEHGFTEEQVMKILKKPDAVYYTPAGTGKLIFRQGEDIVVVRADRMGAGNVITAYGSSGIKGPSGFEALGGSPSDPGGPITHADVVEGRIPGKTGHQPPAEQVR